MTNTVHLERLTEQRYWHVRGDMPMSERAAKLDWFFQVAIDEKNPGESGFIARTGTTEFLVMDKADSDLVAKLQSQSDNGELHLFPRDDAVFRLHHPQWKKKLLEVCSFDFSSAVQGQFVTASMAGVGCWFVIKEVAATHIMFGCDPSYAQYLQETIAEVLK